MKGKKILITIFLFISIIALISKTELVNSSVKSALALCATSVIPALFPFFVLTGLMVSCGAVVILGKILRPLSDKLFKTSGIGAVVFVIGILCGYPTGAKVISELYQKGNLTKDEAERLLAFCNNSGPLFVIGAVGLGMLGNKNLGILLYCIHVISAIITGVFLSLFAKEQKEEIMLSTATQPFGEAFTTTLESAVKSILNVCGYVVFFSCVVAVAKQYIPGVFLNSLLEVTVGAKDVIASGLKTEQMLTLLSGTLGFGGACVYFQVKGAVAKANLSCVCYLFGKTLQMTLSMALMKIYLMINRNVTVFAPGSSTHTVFHISYVILFVFLISAIFTLRRLTKKNRCGIFFL